MKSLLLLSVIVTVTLGQESLYDDGSYVHDTTGDFGPYYYWKLRKQAEAKATGMVKETPRAAAPAVDVAPAPVRQQKPQRQQQQQQQAPRRFANFQATPAAAASAPAPRRTPVRARIPAPVQAVAPAFAPQQQQQQQQRVAPQQPTATAVNADPHFAGRRFQFQIQAPEFNYQNNFAENAYSFSSPFYSTNAQGGSYSYAAVY